MKARSTMIQGALAAVALLAAYFTWQRPKETVTAERVLVVDANKQSFQKARSEDGTHFVELERELSDGEPIFYVTQGYLPGKEPPPFDAGFTVITTDAGVGPDGGVIDAGAPMHITPPPPPPPIRTVRGGERALELFGKLTPFEATRSLGVLPEAKLKDLGFTPEHDRTLTLTVVGGTRSFKVARPPAGMFGWYLRDEKSGEVYVLDGSLLSDFDPSSTLLFDRRLHTFKLKDFDAFTVTVGDKKADFTHSAPDNIAQTIKVARMNTPDQGDELVKNWHDKLFNRTVVTEVLGKGEVPKAGEPQVSLRVDYLLRGKPKGWLELAIDPKGSTFARSENTAGWVAVHQGAEAIVLEAKHFLEQDAAPTKP